jgi:protein-S-isoprenylcysteine O-methyltransferase Ste14
LVDRRDVAGIGLPAPAIFAGAFLLGLLVNWIAPPASVSPAARTLGWVLVLVGIAGIGVPALIALRRAGTTPNPRRPTTALVVRGPYRFTRHPIYLSMALVYAGAALAANTAWVLILLPVAMIVTERGPMVREEQYMEQKFGDAYRAYKAQVRRWI